MLIKKHLTKIKEYLTQHSIDWWLLCSFQNINVIAENLIWAQHTSRKWFCYIDQKGNITFFVNILDKNRFEWFWMPLLTYNNSINQVNWLKTLLNWVKKVCMEYSPFWQLPYVSRIDAWTFELVKSFWIEIETSAQLVQITDSLWWGQVGLDSHMIAMDVLESAVTMAVEQIKKDLDTKWFSDEFEIQSLVMNHFENSWMITNHPIIVAVNGNAADPHYYPKADRSTKIQKWDLVMIDLWCKQWINPNAIYADITKMIYIWDHVPQEIQKVWEVVRDARDTWIDFLKTRLWNGEVVCGYQVDEAVRSSIISNWYWDFFIHRTGHSIQFEDHANGVNIDSYELKDTRQIIKDCWFSIEPWVYLQDKFWVRSEINVYINENNDVVIYWNIQKDLILIK